MVSHSTFTVLQSNLFQKGYFYALHILGICKFQGINIFISYLAWKKKLFFHNFSALAENFKSLNQSKSWNMNWKYIVYLKYPFGKRFDCNILSFASLPLVLQCCKRATTPALRSENEWKEFAWFWRIKKELNFFWKYYLNKNESKKKMLNRKKGSRTQTIL